MANRSNCPGYTRSTEPQIEVRTSEASADDHLSLNISIDLTCIPDAQLVWQGVGLMMAGCMGVEKARDVIAQMQARLDATPKDGRTLSVTFSQQEEKHDGAV